MQLKLSLMSQFTTNILTKHCSPKSDPHTELDNLISTELDNPWVSTELDSQISTELNSAIFMYILDIYWVRQFILSSPVDIE